MKYSAPLLKFFACLFLMIFVVFVGSGPVIAEDKNCLDPKWADHPLCADDPVDPPPEPDPDPDDPCANFSAPDYAFWRDSGLRKAPAKTIFVAESVSGCEKELLQIDLSESGFVNRLYLAYSSVGTGDSFFGRIVFTREWSDSSQGPSVWKYDFRISDGEVQSTGGSPNPVKVLEIDVPENQHPSVRGLDLSADTKSILWKFSKAIGEDLDLWKHSIHTLDLSDCPRWPCAMLDEGMVLVEYDHYTLYPEPSTGWYVQNPVWGPLGDRIYFVARHYQPSYLHSHYVMAIDIASDGSAAGPATEIFGIENQVPGDPSYRHVRSVASGLSGWPDPGEYLAVEIGEDNLVYSCADIYTLNLAACESECTISDLKYEIGGSFQSWLRTGSIVLSGLGGACKFNQIGIWNGLDVNIVTKGYEPEAAGLWPY
jgi:hypothetical protein